MAKKRKREKVADRRIQSVGDGWYRLARESTADPCKHIWQPDGSCYWCDLKKEWVT